MTDKIDIDKQLEKLKKENDKEFKKVVRKSGLFMVFLSILLAATFFYIFYLSPRRVTDILIVITVIIVSVALFAMGLKRYLD